MSEKIYVCVVCGHQLSEADWLSLPDADGRGVGAVTH